MQHSRINLFAAFTGAGAQLCVTTVLLLLCARLGVFRPTKRGSILTCLLVLYSLTSWLGGLMSARYHLLSSCYVWLCPALYRVRSVFEVPEFLVFSSFSLRRIICAIHSGLRRSRIRQIMNHVKISRFLLQFIRNCANQSLVVFFSAASLVRAPQARWTEQKSRRHFPTLVDHFGSVDVKVTSYKLTYACFCHWENVRSSAAHESVTSVYLNLECCTVLVGCSRNGCRRTDISCPRKRQLQIVTFPSTVPEGVHVSISFEQSGARNCRCGIPNQQ